MQVARINNSLFYKYGIGIYLHMRCMSLWAFKLSVMDDYGFLQEIPMRK